MNTNTASRKTYIELLRIIACFSVIINHTNSQIFMKDPTTPEGVVSLAYFFMSKVAVPVFLFIMGALMLGREDSPKKSMMRLVRIAEVIVLFSLAYYVEQYHRGIRGSHPVEFIRTVFAGRTTTAFWYLYAYLGLLCVMPLMQKMSLAFTKNDIRLMALLTLGFAGALPALSAFLDLNVSSNVAASFFPANIALVFTGYYLDRYCEIDKKRFLCACAGYAAMIVMQVVGTLKLYSWELEYYLQLDNYTQVMVTLEAACLFCMVKYILTHVKLHAGVVRLIHALGGLTFGVYLLQDLAVERTAMLFDQFARYMPAIPAVILWELVIFGICAVITFGLKKLPWLGKLL